MSERTKTIIYCVIAIGMFTFFFWIANPRIDLTPEETVSEQDLSEQVIDTAEEENTPKTEPQEATEYYYEPEPVQYESTGDGLTAWGGVYYNDESGYKETWYSQRVLPGGGLDIPGRHVNEQGLVCDGEGYICVACNDVEYGEIVETSLGTAKVYDSIGGDTTGVVDVYTNW